MKEEQPLQPIQASEELGLFFRNLLEIKKFVQDCSLKSEEPYLDEIYQKLNSIFNPGEKS